MGIINIRQRSEKLQNLGNVQMVRGADASAQWRGLANLGHGIGAVGREAHHIAMEVKRQEEDDAITDIFNRYTEDMNRQCVETSKSPDGRTTSGGFLVRNDIDCKELPQQVKQAQVETFNKHLKAWEKENGTLGEAARNNLMQRLSPFDSSMMNRALEKQSRGYRQYVEANNLKASVNAEQSWALNPNDPALYENFVNATTHYLTEKGLSQSEIDLQLQHKAREQASAYYLQLAKGATTKERQKELMEDFNSAKTLPEGMKNLCRMGNSEDGSEFSNKLREAIADEMKREFAQINREAKIAEIEARDARTDKAHEIIIGAYENPSQAAQARSQLKAMRAQGMSAEEYMQFDYKLGRIEKSYFDSVIAKEKGYSQFKKPSEYTAQDREYLDELAARLKDFDGTASQVNDIRMELLSLVGGEVETVGSDGSKVKGWRDPRISGEDYSGMLKLVRECKDKRIHNVVMNTLQRYSDKPELYPTGSSVADVLARRGESGVLAQQEFASSIDAIDDTDNPVATLTGIVDAAKEWLKANPGKEAQFDDLFMKPHLNERFRNRDIRDARQALERTLRNRHVWRTQDAMTTVLGDKYANPERKEIKKEENKKAPGFTSSGFLNMQLR